METIRKRIRKDYAPLTVSVSLSCLSSGSPVTQVYDAAANPPEYVPDRAVTPTVLQPVVTAAASDGSWAQHQCNSLLANMKWYVNGVDITTLNDWTGKFGIDTVGGTRGALTIYRNLTPSERLSMHFEAELVDNRLGVTHPIVTDAILLSTVDKSLDSYSISIGEATAIYYNPFLDKLHLYEYKVSQGLIAASPALRTAALDENAYLRTIPISLFQGATQITTGYTVRLFRVVNANTLTEITASDENEVNAITLTGVTLDLRMVTKENYMIKAYIGAVEVARIQFGVSRLIQGFSCTPTNDSAILPGQTARYDQAMVDSEGKSVECPESIIAIVWYTTSAYKTDVRHNEGGHTVFQLADTGVGDSYNDDWLDIFAEAIQKGAYSVATDESDNAFTDESDNVFIIN